MHAHIRKSSRKEKINSNEIIRWVNHNSVSNCTLFFFYSAGKSASLIRIVCLFSLFQLDWQKIGYKHRAVAEDRMIYWEIVIDIKTNLIKIKLSWRSQFIQNQTINFVTSTGFGQRSSGIWTKLFIRDCHLDQIAHCRHQSMGFGAVEDLVMIEK